MNESHPDQDLMSMFVKTTLLTESGAYDTEQQAMIEHISMNSAQYHEILDHLALCESCRKQVSVITALHEDWADITQESELSETQQESICLFVEDRLTGEDRKEAAALVEKDPAALKAALHYLSHTADMNREHIDAAERTSVMNDRSTDSKNVPASLFSNIYASLSQMFSLRVPLMYSLALTSGIVIAVMLLLQSPELDRSQTMIATYQDRPGIQFTEKNSLPGIGFFSQSKNSSMPFENISVELIRDNVIKISWPVIDGAELYKMRIQVFNNGNKTTLKEISTQNNYTSFELETETRKETNSSDRQNRRYEWILYGNTNDDRMFYTSGGFVVDRVKPEMSGQSEY